MKAMSALLAALGLFASAFAGARDWASFVDPMVGTEGTGSEYGGMMPMTGVPFGSMHLVPVTRTTELTKGG